MSIINFFGIVLPRSNIIEFDCDYEIETNDIEVESQKCKMKIVIIKSKIIVSVKINSFKNEYFEHIYKRIYDICTATIGLISFRDGLGLIFHIESYTIDDSIEYKIIFKDSELMNTVSILKSNTEFVILHKYILQNLTITKALKDLTDSILFPHISVLNCGRAIEAICNDMNPENINSKKKWENMRNILNIDKDYIQFITEYSKEPRHGKVNHITGDKTREIVKRSWTIMNRYFEYVQNGNKKLDQSNYCLIK